MIDNIKKHINCFILNTYIEIVLLIPLPATIEKQLAIQSLLGGRIFLIILILGLLHE